MSLTVLCNASSLTSENKCPGGCVYTCPDGTCAASLASCACTLEATIVGSSLSLWPVPTQVGQDTSIGVLYTASGSYRQTKGSCAAFDFTPYMTLKWRVYAGTNSTAMTLPAGIADNRTLLVLGAKFYTPDSQYTVTASFYDINGQSAKTESYTFTAKAPTPYVSVTSKGAKLIVGPAGSR